MKNVFLDLIARNRSTGSRIYRRICEEILAGMFFPSMERCGETIFFANGSRRGMNIVRWIHGEAGLFHAEYANVGMIQ